MNEYLKPLGKVILLTTVIAVVFYLLQVNDATARFVHPLIWTLVVLQFFVALFISLYHSYFFSKKEENMVNVFLGSTLLRLLFSIAVMVYLLFQTSENRLVLVVDFFLIYLYYMVFEIIGIISNLRAISRK